MPIITADDLKTHIYSRVIDDITEGDATIVPEAIASAIEEAKTYLSKYDLVQLFGDDDATPPVAATVDDKFLKNILKDITVWYLVKLANPEVSYEHARNCYKDAIRKLENIQRGMNDPAWPYKDTTGETAPQGDAIYATSGTKRRNYF